MITYVIVSYLVMIGILLDQYDGVEEMEAIDWFAFVMAPIGVPIIIGMKINK